MSAEDGLSQATDISQTTDMRFSVAPMPPDFMVEHYVASTDKFRIVFAPKDDQSKKIFNTDFDNMVNDFIKSQHKEKLDLLETKVTKETQETVTQTTLGQSYHHSAYSAYSNTHFDHRGDMGTRGQATTAPFPPTCHQQYSQTNNYYTPNPYFEFL